MKTPLPTEEFEVRDGHRVQLWRPSYRVRCTPDAEWQRTRLEALRYKWGGYKDGWRIMQRIADWWEK